MNPLQSTSPTHLISGISPHDRAWWALCTDESKQPFRFLDLPAEIRRIIYDLWIPNVLHVSTGFKGVRLQHFIEAPQGLSFQSISIHPFFLNKQFYQEFCHALFARTTWTFSSTYLLDRIFECLPKPPIDRIRHISVRLTSLFNNAASVQRSDHGILETSALRLAQRHLREMTHLQTLVININLVDFRCCSLNQLTKKFAQANGRATRLAANCVADFTWEGLQTRVPFAASNLTHDFVEILKRRCGEANVAVVEKHKDRYAGQMVDVVISQCKVVDQLSVQGLLTWRQRDAVPECGWGSSNLPRMKVS